MKKSLANYILWGCFFWVFTHQIFLLFPAKYEFLYNFGMLLQAFTLSYIAAYLFYVVYTILPNLKFKKQIGPVICQELSELWEICNNLSYQFYYHSNVTAYQNSNKNFNVTVPEQIANLPVLPRTVNKPQNNIADGKSINLQIESFNCWSNAIQYVIARTDKSINLIISLKDILPEETKETLVKIVIMQKALADFQHIAKTYEISGRSEKFNNIFIQREMIKFYEALEDLKTYKDKHDKYKQEQYNIYNQNLNRTKSN
ncbi:hypothetical protein COL82_29905 [Bacillus toyonensis]|uniref:hypothetical protein n=1 Tax=Bacillus toyonensis TaxID=155322 RepID=UPI000BF6E12E|nr:hypothetical protein [Bacillus toyonensis]PFZ70599.1 hypothetical protein COL82_29905 [Bacillus toyonensis]